MIDSCKKIFVIAGYTFKEIYKSRVMLNVLLLGAALGVVSYIAAEFTYGVPGKIALDFGLGALTLSCVGISLFMGSLLVAREVDSRTIYMVLSRPVSRINFLIGRLLGMSLFIGMNTLILGSIALFFYAFFDGQIQGDIFWSIFFIFIESLIVLVMVVNFTLITNTTVSVICSICLYALGHVLPQTLDLKIVQSRPVLETFIEVYSWIFPNFSKLNIKKLVLYDQAIESSFLWMSSLYGFIYIFFLVFIAIFLFSRKSLD